MAARGVGAPAPTPRPVNLLVNAICLLMTSAVFATIAIEAGNQPSFTHSGTQAVIRK